MLKIALAVILGNLMGMTAALAALTGGVQI